MSLFKGVLSGVTAITSQPGSLFRKAFLFGEIMDKIVDWRLYDPRNSIFKGSGNDRAEFKTVRCNNSENCSAFKRGQCTMFNFSGERCPYGSRRREEGFTQRARKYSSWIAEKRESVNGIPQLNTLDKVAIIGEYIFFPYPHWSLNFNHPGIKSGGFFSSGTQFIKKELFTVELFEKIINVRPQAMMGGTIKSYQEEVVPKIAMEVSEELPEFYAEWEKAYPETASRFKEKNYVGRKAYLNTVVPGSVFTKGNIKFTWSGGVLKCEGMKSPLGHIIWAGKGEYISQYTPTDNDIVTIEDNSQVDCNTKFK